jgi:hypothetical protein
MVAGQMIIGLMTTAAVVGSISMGMIMAMVGGTVGVINCMPYRRLLLAATL